MTLLDELAQLHDNYDGHALIDYFALYLPCHIVFLDAVTIAHHKLPAISEFVLRSIADGLRDAEEIGGLLGLSDEYANFVLSGLLNDEFVGQDPFGRYTVQRRGQEALSTGEDLVPLDTRLMIAWDPIAKKVLPRTPMYTPGRITEGAIVAPVAKAYAPVVLADIDIQSLKESRIANRGPPGHEGTKFDVIRLIGVHKSLMRLRETLGLVYRSSSNEVVLRIVVDGRVDDELSAICVQNSLPRNIGVEKASMQRVGVAAVKKRYGELRGGEAVAGASLEQLAKARAVLRFKLDGLNRRLEEGAHEGLQDKRKAALLELNELEEKLGRLAILPLRCYEVRRCLLDALASANASLVVTTSLPSLAKVDAVVLEAIRKALVRGVRVRVLIAGRMVEKNPTMAHLNRLTEKHGLAVDFLSVVARPVFEITWDGERLILSNESPLGVRVSPVAPREFVGYFVSDKRMVAEYVQQHMNFGGDNVIKRHRIPAHIPRSRPNAIKKSPRRAGTSAKNK